MRQFILQLKSDRHRHLATFLVALAFLQAIIFIIGGDAVFPEDSKVFPAVAQVSGLIMLFLFGCAGFVIMIRQEVYQVVKITGKPAQVFGFLIWTFCWTFVVRAIVLWITGQLE